MSEHRQLAPTTEQAWENLARLDFSRYLGNTCLIGIAPEGESYQQVCWLVGRDEQERSKAFETDTWKQGEYIRTAPHPEGDCNFQPYPSLISVHDEPGRRVLHVATTGNQTRAIADSMRADPKRGRMRSLPFGANTAMYDPDPHDPRHTPRVSALLAIGVGVKNLYNPRETHVNYNLLTRGGYTEVDQYPLRMYAAPGVALAAHSYHKDAGVPQLFEGQPYALPIFDDPETTRDFWWEQLPAEQRVAIAVLSVSRQQRSYAIRNA